MRKIFKIHENKIPRRSHNRLIVCCVTSVTKIYLVKESSNFNIKMLSQCWVLPTSANSSSPHVSWKYSLRSSFFNVRGTPNTIKSSSSLFFFFFLRSLSPERRRDESVCILQQDYILKVFIFGTTNFCNMKYFCDFELFLAR